MSEDKPVEIFTGDLKVLADAKSVQNRAVNRLWILTASVTLFVISAKISNDGTVRFLGFLMDGNALYPISTLVLALLNIAYCSAHIHTYKITKIFQQYLISNNLYEKKFVSSFSVADVAHSIYTTIIFRSFNFVSEVPIRFRAYFYVFIKITSESMYLAIPVIGMIISYAKISGGVLDLLLPLVYLSMLISFLSTLTLAWISFRFALQTYKRLRHEKDEVATNI